MNTKRFSSEVPDAPGAGLESRVVTEQHADHLSSSKTDLVACEVPIAFAYNGISHAVMMASPLDLHDFAVGFSITERVVDSLDDIRKVEINQAKQGFTVQLHIAPHLIERLGQQKRQMSGRSGCGVCGITDLAAAIPNLAPLPKRAKPSHKIVSLALAAFKQNQPLQSQSGATHCAGWFDGKGQLIALREDIGRHNALDKLIGAGLRDDQRQTTYDDFIILSSRASHELITKSVIAGVGSLVTISAATTLAIDMAQKLNLNLIGFVRGERQVIYTS